MNAPPARPVQKPCYKVVWFQVLINVCIWWVCAVNVCVVSVCCWCVLSISAVGVCCWCVLLVCAVISVQLVCVCVCTDARRCTRLNIPTCALR